MPVCSNRPNKTLIVLMVFILLRDSMKALLSITFLEFSFSRFMFLSYMICLVMFNRVRACAAFSLIGLNCSLS